MIKRLRRRMTLMVIAVLILVSAGIVLAIHYANERSIAAQAESTLSVLAENSGSRPSLPPDGSTPADMNETPPPKPDGDGSDPAGQDSTPPPKPDVESDAPPPGNGAEAFFTRKRCFELAKRAHVLYI